MNESDTETSLVVQPAGVEEPDQLKNMPPAWKEMDLVIDGCKPTRLAGCKQFEIAYMMADGVERLRKLMTPAVMKPIMALMNTEIGFLTDRGPHISVRNDKDNWKLIPYSEAVVRDVMVTALLHGVWPVGNQINIITSKFYITQMGYLYKMNNVPGLTELKTDIKPPMQAPNGMATVVTICTWNVNGQPDECNQTFGMKAGSYDTADSLRSKAYRKILKAAHQQLTGGSLLGVSSDRDDFNQITPPARSTVLPPVDAVLESIDENGFTLRKQPHTDSRVVILDLLIKEYSEAWNINQIESTKSIRAYIKKVFNFDSIGPCTEDDFNELLRRVRLGPFHNDRLPSPDEISIQQVEPPTQSSSPRKKGSPHHG